MTWDGNDLRIRPGKVGDRAAKTSGVRRKPRGFLAEVHQAIRRTGGDPNRLTGKRPASGRFNARGRGAKVEADLRLDKDTLETMKRNRALLIGRAQHLEKLGLAEQIEPGVWHLSGGAEPTLRAMGERGDIFKSMYRALEANGLEAQRGSSHVSMHRDGLQQRTVCNS